MLDSSNDSRFCIIGGLVTDLPISNSGQPTHIIAQNIAQNAGKLIRDRFHTHKEVSYKDLSSLVTDVDRLVERNIRHELATEFPEIGFLGEELGSTGKNTGLRWIVDPVDGTRNYVANIPHFAISLALANDQDILLGVTYDPMRDEMFHTVKGHGAFLNHNPISISNRWSVSESILGIDIGAMDNKALEAFKLIEFLWPGLQTVRIMGSATLGLAYVSAGRLDIYLHHTLGPWDVGAGLLLVREAGGKITDRLLMRSATLQSSGLVASNPHLLEEFLILTEGQGWYSAS
jgi:myo-inositol-1(or 4)-monophosphatase